MKIGFDAKRLFFNRSGLGNYSRSTVELLHKYFQQNEYLLFSPKEGNNCDFIVPNDMSVVYPSGLFKKLSSVWRSYAMSGSIRKSGVDIYHGLSNELPSDIHKAGVRSIVTVHDLIFVRYPELYKPADRYLYTKKYRGSCNKADHIIAISEQTKEDLVNLWNIPKEKISVVYQGCNPMFAVKVSDKVKGDIRSKYGLPARFILSVGTIEPRKNLMLTLQAMAGGVDDIDLVAIGKYTPYVDELKVFAEKAKISHRIHYIHNVEWLDLPAIYQMSEVFVYMSVFEGFGIPILEGLNSGVPVITTSGGVFGETGGNACFYVDQGDVGQMAGALYSALTDRNCREDAIIKGHVHAAKFKEEQIAANLMSVYNKIL